MDDDYAVLYASSTTWSVQAGYTAQIDLTDADGTYDGMGYIETMNYRYGTVSGLADMVREQFAVSGASRTVPSASVRVRRTYGPSGQATTDGGSTWADLSLWSPVDLQFYFK